MVGTGNREQGTERQGVRRSETAVSSAE